MLVMIGGKVLLRSGIPPQQGLRWFLSSCLDDLVGSLAHIRKRLFVQYPAGKPVLSLVISDFRESAGLSLVAFAGLELGLFLDKKFPNSVQAPDWSETAPLFQRPSPCLPIP